ncbi:hypothetical protein STA3757_44930 [Stanieria sp. NIES-3757]|nr:hypothetical protein STA3757_44930 [Stanieria sp. NIES-3757]
MNKMAELLAQLKAEYQENEKTQSLSENVTSSARSHKELTSNSSQASVNLQSETSLDALLAEVKNQVDQPELSENNNFSRPVSSSSLPQSTTKHDLIGQLQQEYQAKERREQELKQQEQILQEQQQEQKKQRRKQALQEKAQQWLKKLEPNSEEGLWFEEFAYNYESKLAAAIDYLAAINETHNHH